MPKYLLIFEKGEGTRWLAHLDILRAFERAVRRAELPVAFSQGFNPREKLAFASAMGVGLTGEAEPALIELTEPRPPDAVRDALNDAFPPGLHIHFCRELTKDESDGFLARFHRAEYRALCQCPPETSSQAVEQAINALLLQTEVIVAREREGRVKRLDIRPHLYDLKLMPDSVSAERLTLEMTLGMGESGNVRPAEVVTSLANWIPELKARRVHRVRLMQGSE